MLKYCGFGLRAGSGSTGGDIESVFPFRRPVDFSFCEPIIARLRPPVEWPSINNSATCIALRARSGEGLTMGDFGFFLLDLYCTIYPKWSSSNVPQPSSCPWLVVTTKLLLSGRSLI